MAGMSRSLLGAPVAAWLAALFFIGCPSRTHTPGETEEGGPPMNTDANFSCDDAPRLLGAPEAKLVRCTTTLPNLHTVVLERPPGGPPHTTMHSFVWQDGAVVEGGGLGSLQRYLADHRAHERDDLTREAAEVLLIATAGAPPGFSPQAIHGSLRDVAGGVTVRPFSVTLVQNHWTAPADPAGAPPGQPPGPPPGMQPPGGPPAGMQPPGGPPAGMQPPGGPPPGLQPPGGAAPPLVAKAVLTLDADYRGAWVISVMMPFGQAFEPKLTVPLAP
jgi:hypothetical protein